MKNEITITKEGLIVVEQNIQMKKKKHRNVCFLTMIFEK